MIYVLDQVKNTIEMFESETGSYVRTFEFNEEFAAGRASRKLVENPLSVRVNLNTMAIVDWKRAVVLFDTTAAMNVRTCIELDQVASACLVSDHSTPRSLKLFLHSSSTGQLVGYRLFDFLAAQNQSAECDGRPDPVPARVEFRPCVVFEQSFDELKCNSESMIYSMSSGMFVLTLGWSKSLAVVRLY